MKYNKKLIGLVAGLVFLVLCLILLLATCGGREETPANPTDPSQSAVTDGATAGPTDGAETEEPTGEATESTEEATEATEETTEATTGGSSTPGGTGGFTGGGTVDDDTTGDKEEEVLTVAAPGTAGNPYAEVFDIALGSFTTVKVSDQQPVFYNLYSVRGSVLTIEGEGVYVVYKDTTYEAREGTVSLTLEDDGSDTAVPVQIGTGSTEATAYTVSFAWPDGSEGKPFELTVGQIPGIAATAQIGAGSCVYYHVYGVNGTTVTIEDAGVRAVYKDKLYEAVDGVLSVDIAEGDAGTPALLGIVNAGESARQFTLKADYKQGSANSPYPLQAGEFVTDLAEGNARGVYYRYTAEADGVMTLQYVSGTEGVGCEYLLLNQNTFDCRTLSSDGVTDEATGITTVSIPVSQGDVLQLIVAALPGEDGTYPAAQITTLAAFEAGAVLPDEGRVTYTISVADGAAAPMAGVRLSVQLGNLTVPVVTDANGNASLTLAAGTYQAVLTVPAGFEAEKTEFELTAEAPAVSITLKLPEVTDIEYSVTVADYNGAPQANVMVQFQQDGNVVAVQSTDNSGTARATLTKGDYTVKLAFSTEGYYYDETMAVLSVDAPALQISVATGLGTEFAELYVGNAYYLTTGGTYVGNMQTNVTNYFIFEPTVSGLYRFTTSNPAAVISYWGSSTAFIQDLTSGTDYADNAFTQNVKDKHIGGVCIIGVTGASECIVEITRISDAVLDESDIVPEVYKAKTAPKPFTLNLGAGQTLVNVDITAATDAYTLVLGADGYYHLGSETGPVMYVNLGPKAPYVSMYNMLGYAGYGGTSFSKTYYDGNGKALWKEDYTACMCQYVESIDATYGVYPLTEDLMYMLQQGGSHKGWWDSTNGNFLFAEVPNLNTEIAWMFACCYVQ